MLILEIWRAIISSEEYKQSLIQYTRLFLSFRRELPFNSRRREPHPLGGVKNVIILKNNLVMSSVDNQLVSISSRAMEGSLIRHKFLRLHNAKLMDVNFSESVCKIIVYSSCIMRDLPPKI